MRWVLKQTCWSELCSTKIESTLLPWFASCLPGFSPPYPVLLLRNVLYARVPTISEGRDIKNLFTKLVVIGWCCPVFPYRQGCAHIKHD